MGVIRRTRKILQKGVQHGRTMDIATCWLNRPRGQFSENRFDLKATKFCLKHFGRAHVFFVREIKQLWWGPHPSKKAWPNAWLPTQLKTLHKSAINHYHCHFNCHINCYFHSHCLVPMSLPILLECHNIVMKVVGQIYQQQLWSDHSWIWQKYCIPPEKKNKFRIFQKLNVSDNS